ncbi:MAG: toll/interleukin-1 receptor domain-containing protein [Nitrospira sp.]|nr:MAG: toll/interleukin-1 receptor domain-containing protein [Nitrospira sp.]
MELHIFLSHSSIDGKIADALRTLLNDLFGDGIAVEFSSDQKAGGGIPPGENWLPWINEKISAADKTYVLLTPNSMNKPWVLWESGAAAGVALASNKSSPVVPVTFGISNDDIPSPFASTQHVKGDTKEAGGILRLLQDLNKDLGKPLTDKVFELLTNNILPGFFQKVKDELEESAPLESLLSSVPHLFSVSGLGGHWVSSYQFTSGGATMCHSEVVQLIPESERRLRGRAQLLEPRTEGRDRPFRNEIDFELANRHLLGHWKNISDTRYFGTIHLAVLQDENVLEGHYTAFASDVSVASGPWKWVRINPETLKETDLSKMVLRAPAEIQRLLAAHKKHAGPLNLAEIVVGSA